MRRPFVIVVSLALASTGAAVMLSACESSNSTDEPSANGAAFLTAVAGDVRLSMVDYAAVDARDLLAAGEDICARLAKSKGNADGIDLEQAVDRIVPGYDLERAKRNQAPSRIPACPCGTQICDLPPRSGTPRCSTSAPISPSTLLASGAGFVPIGRAGNHTRRVTLPRMADDEQLDRLATALRGADQIVVLTGAGISTESGIPDFRGPQGLWTKDPSAERKATIQHYVADADHRRQVWRNRAGSELFGGEPNAGHYALAELERRAHLHTLVTQNVDGLHQAAGTSPEIVIEIHGTVHGVKCLACGWRGPMEETLERVRAGEDDPACRECGGMLKSATISFGENLVAEDLERAQRAAAGADVFLAVGTSLGVYPAAALPEQALRTGAVLAVLNAEETPFDPLAEFVLRDRLGDVLPDLVARI